MGLTKDLTKPIRVYAYAAEHAERAAIVVLIYIGDRERPELEIIKPIDVGIYGISIIAAIVAMRSIKPEFRAADITLYSARHPACILQRDELGWKMGLRKPVAVLGRRIRELSMSFRNLKVKRMNRANLYYKKCHKLAEKCLRAK